MIPLVAHHFVRNVNLISNLALPFPHAHLIAPLHSNSYIKTCGHLLLLVLITQFHVTIQCLQCDNDGEFLTSNLHDFFPSHGVFPSVSPALTPPLKMIKLDVVWAPHIT
jgi:hypothetical protein